MEIAFVAGFSAIVDDADQAAGVFRDALGLPIEGDDYRFTDALPGVKHFGVWPLRQAAQSCFGSDTWPSDVPIPQATIEFDVATPEEVETAAAELEQLGLRLVHPAKREVWGQTIVRFLTPEGLLIGVSYTPWMHDG